MDDEIIAKIDKMNLDDLSYAAKVVLSRLYSKLRDDEGFGFEQYCTVTSFGSNPYDINLVIIDAISRSTGSEWEHVWWV